MARQVTVNIIGDAKNFTKATQEATAASEGFGSKLGGIAMLGAGALLGLGGAVVGFGVSAVEHMSNAGQAAYEMSEKFGISTQAASQWASVAKQLGIDSETVGTGF